MGRVISLLLGAATVFGFLAYREPEAATPAAPPVASFAPVLEAPSPVSVAPTTTLPVPAEARCPQWWGLAREVGFTEDQLPTLDYVMWKESRCQPDAHNTTLNKNGTTDVGLVQVNDASWCLPNSWHDEGYLQRVDVLTTVGCEQLFDPTINLRAAKAIHDYAEKHYGNGWQPWRL